MNSIIKCSSLLVAATILAVAVIVPAPVDTAGMLICLWNPYKTPVRASKVIPSTSPGRTPEPPWCDGWSRRCVSHGGLVPVGFQRQISRLPALDADGSIMSRFPSELSSLTQTSTAILVHTALHSVDDDARRTKGRRIDRFCE